MAGRAEHGRKAAHSEKPSEFLSNTQKTTSRHNLSYQGSTISRGVLSNYSRQPIPNETNGNTLFPYNKENIRIDDLEDNLRKLKVQVDSLASSLNLETKPYYTDMPEWPKHINSPSFGDSADRGQDSASSYERFLKTNHLLKSQESFPTTYTSGFPTSLNRPVGTIGRLTSEMDSTSITPSDISYVESVPLTLGAPHVVGVYALLPPKFPVHSQSPERTGVSIVQGRLRSLDRSHSFSPASKKTRYLRSRSQSPKRIWKPNSPNANACGQPAPSIKSNTKTSSSNRQSRLRFSRPGSVAERSFTPPREDKSSLTHSWTPYSMPSSAVAAPSAEEISERFLKTLPGRNVGISVVEASPYQQELTRLRLERLRLEEELLPELRRQQELERTRGPKPKWYEMKGSQFHYEARKNNELLKSSKDYQSIYNYLQDLSSASRDFQEELKFTHVNGDTE